MRGFLLRRGGTSSAEPAALTRLPLIKEALRFVSSARGVPGVPGRHAGREDAGGERGAGAAAARKPPGQHLRGSDHGLDGERGDHRCEVRSSSFRVITGHFQSWRNVWCFQGTICSCSAFVSSALVTFTGSRSHAVVCLLWIIC